MNKKVVKDILDWVIHLALAIVLGIAIIVFLGRLTVVDGNSMTPTLQNQDVLIIESVTPRFGDIKPGDIVVVKIPELLDNRKKYAIKRVIATEDQHVEIRDKKIYVNGVSLTEDYINGVETFSEDPMYTDMIVPKGCIYILGDNRIPEKSRDSRTFGAVNTDRIIGKSWIRLFPFSEAGPVR